MNPVTAQSNYESTCPAFFISFTIRRWKASFAPSRICEQEMNERMTEDEGIKRQMRREKEEANRENSEREKRPPAAEIAVSVLAFIRVVGDAMLKVSVLDGNKPRKRRWARWGLSQSSRINLNRQLFNWPNLPISYTHDIGKKKGRGGRRT